jgi:hypothetical protein
MRVARIVKRADSYVNTQDVRKKFLSAGQDETMPKPGDLQEQEYIARKACAKRKIL